MGIVRGIRDSARRRVGPSALAGILLGLLFRWRGPGVAAWSHGLFNLALLLGIDPDVVSS